MRKGWLLGLLVACLLVSGFVLTRGRAPAREVPSPVPAAVSAAPPPESPQEQIHEPALEHVVVVYTTSWCGWCRKTLNFLREEGVAFENRDIEANEMWRDELIEKTGDTGIPVVEIDGTIVRGYRPGRMAELLRDG